MALDSSLLPVAQNDKIRRLLSKLDNRKLSRGKLARQICDWLDWRNPKGELKEVSCRKGLLKLHRQGMLAEGNGKPW